MRTYVVTVGDDWFSYVHFYRWAIALRKVNKRIATCIECGEKFEEGKCVYKSQYGGNGYVCIPCTKKLILEHGEKGYSQNILSGLQANNFETGKWEAKDIACALHLDKIDDGFGNEWDAFCDNCGSRSMQVVRPGRARCTVCEE